MHPIIFTKGKGLSRCTLHHGTTWRRGGFLWVLVKGRVSCWGQNQRLKQNSSVRLCYLFGGGGGVQPLSITGLPLRPVSQAGEGSSSHISQLVPGIPPSQPQWSTFHERHLKVGLNGLIFPIMSRRRSLASHALCYAAACTVHDKSKGDGVVEINTHLSLSLTATVSLFFWGC